MRENTLKDLGEGRGGGERLAVHPRARFSAEVMAHQGFDSLTIDMQHGVVDYQVAVTMLQGISTTGVVPLARVPWNDPARLMKILDAGAYGVICPMINTREEAEALVRACKYPPRGYRSWGPVRASIYAGTDYGDHANDDIVVMPMIETAEAVKNIDEILSVPGVDAVYVGPSDLSPGHSAASRGWTRPMRRWWKRRRRSPRRASATTWSRASTTAPRPTRSR